MFDGEHINSTEDRAVLHVATRAPRDRKIIVDGHDVVPDVHEVLDKIKAFSDKARTRCTSRDSLSSRRARRSPRCATASGSAPRASP